MGDVHEFHHLRGELVDELLDSVSVNLGGYSVFAEPFFENGVGDCFGILFLDRCDNRVFCEGIGDA